MRKKSYAASNVVVPMVCCCLLQKTQVVWFLECLPTSHASEPKQSRMHVSKRVSGKHASGQTRSHACGRNLIGRPYPPNHGHGAQCDNHAASIDVGLIFTYLGDTRVPPLGRVTTCGHVHNGNTSVVHRSFDNCPTVMPSGTVQSRRKPRDALACSACYLEKGWLGKDPVI
jgi:hypothetical protein